MANLKITIDRGPAETGAETGRIHVGIFHTPDCSPQSLTALMPDSLVKAPRNRSLPEAVPLGAAFNTPSRTACFQLNCKTRKEDRATLKLRAMPISSAAWKAAVSIGKTYETVERIEKPGSELCFHYPFRPLLSAKKNDTARVPPLLFTYSLRYFLCDD